MKTEEMILKVWNKPWKDIFFIKDIDCHLLKIVAVACILLTSMKCNFCFSFHQSSEIRYISLNNFEQNYEMNILMLLIFLQESDTKKKESMDVSEPPTAVAS